MRNSKLETERKLEELSKYYLENSIDEKLPEILKSELGIDIKGKYGKINLIHPILVAPGQLTREIQQIEKIKMAGYAGCVLKSVVGEDENGLCSMSIYRKKMTYLKTVYEDFDKEGIFPVILWDGRGDVRSLNEYIKFAVNVFPYLNENFLIVTSIICHFPGPDEELKKEEWIYTTKRLFEIGYNIFEIDFCPALIYDEKFADKKNILRWYREIPGVVKSVSKNINVFCKILNLDYGIDFQVEIVKEAVKGGADGVIIGNRIFKKELNCAWGGKELRERNLIMIKTIKEEFPDLSISGTGGIYTGKHICQYLKAGAENVQILSYILGKVKKDFIKKKGNKFDKVLYELLFHPFDGLIPVLVKDLD